MRRREFIKAIAGGAAAWPLAARAQQSTMPIVGFLSSVSASTVPRYLAAFHAGLAETGYRDGDNVAIEYRWAEGQYHRLPALAADLVARRVNVIAAVGGTTSVLAARSATSTIPILFSMGGDPVKLGLVRSMNRPGGNITGVQLFSAPLTSKRMEMLHELIQKVITIGFLVNPNNANLNADVAEMEAGARAIGQRIVIVKASGAREIDGAFTSLAAERVGALVVATDPFFEGRGAQFVSLAARHAIPAIYHWRDFVMLGGLMSYGDNIAMAYRQLGVYTGRILKGEKTAELPVHQSTKFELVINLKTAKALGLSFPLPLLGRADEVIE